MSRLEKLKLFGSVRSQLLFWLLMPLIGVGALAIYDGYRTALSTADIISDRVLVGSALAIAERVFVNDENELEVDIPYVALQMLTTSEDDRVFYKIEADDGAFITGYSELDLPSKGQSNDDVSFHDTQFRGELIRVVIHKGVTSSSTRSFRYRVAIAETVNARNAIARSILLRSSVRQMLLLAVMTIFIWFAVRRALRPLRRLQNAVGRRSPDDVRPIEHEVPQEVQGLVSTINDLVKRFSASIQALQNFTSNASHQFRTPLALIKTHLEIAQQEDDISQQKIAIAKAKDAVGNAERVMAQLVLLSRLDTASSASLNVQQTELCSVSRGVCEEFVLQLSHFGQHDVDLGFEENGPVNVYAEETLVAEIVRNLVDNAIKHAGPSPKIDVMVDEKDGFGRILVRDDGAGFEWSNPNDTENNVAARIQSAHHGVGLSIVSEIVTLLNGQLYFTRDEITPSMKVTVSFKSSRT